MDKEAGGDGAEEEEEEEEEEGKDEDKDEGSIHTIFIADIDVIITETRAEQPGRQLFTQS